MSEENINADGSVFDPIEELAEILCRVFECEDAVRLYRRINCDPTAGREERIKSAELAGKWFDYLANAHEDLQDLFPESNLPQYLDETGTYL